MSAQPTTIKIKSDSDLGYAIINESDFVEGEHELFDAPAEVVAPIKPSTARKHKEVTEQA